MINLLNYVCVYLGKMTYDDYNLMQKKEVYLLILLYLLLLKFKNKSIKKIIWIMKVAQKITLKTLIFIQ